jgi:hypothetical protein
MEIKKDSNGPEVGMQPSASNVRKFNHKEGEGPMETTANTQRAETRSDQVGQFGKSHLRMARYQSMKSHLMREGVFILRKDSEKLFDDWTREQIEQALEDVINCGYGEVSRIEDDGAIIIYSIEKDEK